MGSPGMTGGSSMHVGKLKENDDTTVHSTLAMIFLGIVFSGSLRLLSARLGSLSRGSFPSLPKLLVLPI